MLGQDKVTLVKKLITQVLFDLVPDVCSPAALAKTEIDRIDVLFQRLIEAVGKGEFPEKGQRLLSKISTTLSSFADSDVSVPGRELNWDAPNVSQNLLQVSAASIPTSARNTNLLEKLL